MEKEKETIENKTFKRPGEKTWESSPDNPIAKALEKQNQEIINWLNQGRV